MATRMLVFLTSFKRDVTAMRQFIVTHDTLFTLARNYRMKAARDIEYIYHPYLVANHANNSSKAEEGLDSGLWSTCWVALAGSSVMFVR